MNWFDETYAANALPLLMDHLAEDRRGRYVPRHGPAVECTGIRTNAQTALTEEDLGERKVTQCDWIISTDPQSEYGGVTAPELTAVVEFDDWGVFAIEDVVAKSGSTVMLSLTQMPLTRRSRPQFRRSA